MPRYNVHVAAKLDAVAEIEVFANSYEEAEELALDKANKSPRDVYWDAHQDSADDFEVVDTDLLDEPVTEKPEKVDAPTTGRPHD